MSKEIKFTKEQIDYIKHCGEHFEVLTGGRGHSKTKQIIEQLQQENKQLKEKVGELTQSLNEQMKETNKENLDCSKYAIENNQLKEKINTYEDPEDLTLMFMYCDEKAKDKIKQLKEVIEEVRKYIEETPIGSILEVHCGDEEEYTKPLLQILDKVKENK